MGDIIKVISLASLIIGSLALILQNKKLRDTIEWLEYERKRERIEREHTEANR